MIKTTRTDPQLKRMVKEVLLELLQDDRELFRQIFAEALEDFALAEAVKEGRKSRKVPREAVFDLLKAKS